MLIVLLLSAIIFNRCGTTTNIPNYAHLYSGTTSVLQPKFVIYHDNESTSKVYFKINSEELLYVRKDKSEPYHSSILIHYKLYNDIGSKVIVDSASKRVEDITDERGGKSIIGDFDVKVPIGDKYFLKILTTDLNRGSVDEKHIQIDKRNKVSSQFFLVRKAKDSVPVFTNFLIEKGEFLMKSKLNSGKPIQGRYYNRKFPLAAPPFTVANSKPFKYTPDSISQLQLDSEGNLNFTLQDSGFVHFQVDTTVKLGLTIYKYDQNFPLIKNSEGMAFPLRYISTRNEYNAMMTSENLKLTIDKFWISKTGSKERARELIKKYYNRVQTSNEYFTSYIEGWKTDRGMINLIFGSPRVVNKTKDSEVWIYGEESNAMSLRFTFDKVNNPFTGNDYKLSRSASYRTNWYRAVDAWRSGRVYWVN